MASRPLRQRRWQPSSSEFDDDSRGGGGSPICTKGCPCGNSCIDLLENVPEVISRLRNSKARRHQDPKNDGETVRGNSFVVSSSHWASHTSTLDGFHCASIVMV